MVYLKCVRLLIAGEGFVPQFGTVPTQVATNYRLDLHIAYFRSIKVAAGSRLMSFAPLDAELLPDFIGPLPVVVKMRNTRCQQHAHQLQIGKIKENE